MSIHLYQNDLPEDLDLLTVVDDPDDVVAAIEAATP